jgi:hypothetical protein
MQDFSPPNLMHLKAKTVHLNSSELHSSTKMSGPFASLFSTVRGRRRSEGDLTHMSHEVGKTTV